MTRPFELHQMPPIFGEVKNGERGKKYPVNLDHWKVVERVRVGDNWKKLQDVHDALTEKYNQGPEPKSLPIVLLSDTPEENMAGFRGLFDKSKLMCGTPYPSKEGEDTYLLTTESGKQIHPGMAYQKDEGHYAIFLKGSEEVVPKKFVDFETMTARNNQGNTFDVQEVELNAERVSAATRYFTVQNGSIVTEDVDPYKVACHQGCPYWQEDDRDNLQCTLQHTLYFHLGPGLPYSDRLFVYRASSIYAQRTLIPSIKMIHNMTGGILANIPLRLEFRQESRSYAGGRKTDMPHPAVTIGSDVRQFEQEVVKEIERRQNRFELMHGRRAESLEELKREGMLVGMQTRAALESVATDVTDVEESQGETQEPSPELPEKLQHLFEKAGYTPRKQELLMEKHEGDVDKIIAEVEDHIDDMPSIPSKEVGESDVDFFS